MEGSESAINRFGRAIWTVWGYLTGSVGRYLRPDVTNEEAHNVHFKQEDTVPIGKGHKELKVKEEEKERIETKTSERRTREDLQYPGVRVRAAAVQWEKGNIAHDGHEGKDKSKPTCASSEGTDKKSQMKKDNENTLDNKSGSRKTHSNQFTELKDSPAYIDADIKYQDRTGSEEADLNVERSETHQEQTNKLEEEEKIMRREFDETEEEPVKSEFIDQGLLAKEADLNVERSETHQEQTITPEEEEKIMRREFDETEEEPIKSEFIDQGLLAKEADLNVKMSDNSQEQRRKSEEEEESVSAVMRRENDETEEPIKRESIDQGLLAKEADLNVEMDENNQEQRTKQEEDEGYVDEIMKRENDETKEEPIKSEFIDQGLLTKEADLNVERSESSQEQRKKLEEEGLVEMMRRDNDEPGEEPIKSKFIEQGFLAEEADLNVERDENNQQQRMKQEEDEECVDEIMKRENDETDEEPIKSEFIDQGLLTKEADLNVEQSEISQEQIMEPEEEDIIEIIRRENDEPGEEPIKSKFIEQGLLAKEADLNVEMDENNQEQRTKQEEESVSAVMRRDNDEPGEEPIKSKFIEQGLLAEEADLNVEMDENNQEQRRKPEEGEEGVDEILRREEGVDEILRTEYDETEEELIKSESIDQGLLAKEADLNVERNENNQQQRRKEEEECVDEIMKKENDETEEEPIKSEFIDQDIITKEADLNVERSESSQEQRKKLEEEGLVEMMRRDNDEPGEEPIKSKFIEQGLLAEEADLNVEMDENNQEQRRKPEEGEEGVDEILRREYDETEEEPIKSEFTDQGLLAKEADLNVERNENNQQQRKKEEEECVDEIMKKEYDETEEEPIKSEFIDQGLLAKEADLNVERNENSQQQSNKSKEEEGGADEISRREYERETEEKPIKGRFTDQGLDPEEQASVCGMGDTAVVSQGTTEHENEASKSRMVDEGLFIQLASTWEGRVPLNDGLKLENALLLQEKEVIEVSIEETKQETVGKLKDGYQEEFSVCEQFTGTDIVEEQKVCDTEMKETLKQTEVIDRSVDTECQLLETADIENAEIYKKVSEPSRMSEDEDNNLAVTMKMQQLEQSNKEQKAISEVALNVDLRQLDDTAHDHNVPQRPAVVTKQDFEGFITRPETRTGNKMETVETTSKFRAEVAAVDVKKSAEGESSFHEQPIDREEVAVQEIMSQCLLEQGSLLEESAESRINELSLLEAPFSQSIKSVPIEQLDDSAVESVDEMQSSSLQELDECSSKAELKVEAKSSSPEQTAECEISFVENTCDKSILDETPLADQINQDECTLQDSTAEASSHKLQIGLSEALYLPERESEQEALEMQRDSQKDTEEQERTGEAETGLLDEIKDAASCLGVVEEIAKEREDSEWELLREMEAPERKEHKSELESHEEMSESSMNVELLNDTWECKKELVAEMTDIETMVVSTGGEMESMKKMEEPITEEEKDKCQLVFSESEASKEISKEHEEKFEHGESVVDSKEDVEERGRPGLKRGFEKMAGDNDEDKPGVLTDLLLPSQASSLDFTVQKSKIAVKNPLVRPPKDPRTLINMASVEPLTPPQPSQPGFLKKSHIQGPSVPSKGVIGFKLPGLGAGFPALRKTEAGRKIRDGEDSESVTSQKSDSGSQSTDDNVKQETSPPKPKWTPPRQPGMGSPLMMAELKSKLKKPAKE
ncbi:trichohyalin isoform X2 [Pangasianodon hypophthalmus]|uniref:trichohyalin isoform X2 n=1 Tax=Pangasianodon hypophthalmus TaxID=310915 RepID=UPI002306F0CF|nr:trichohyalin isoform X2 [Pangasianodon hypophthalmus]